MTPGEISVLADLARRRSGVVIDADKTYIIESRLAPIARKQGFTSLSELISDLQQRQDDSLIWATVDDRASTVAQIRLSSWRCCRSEISSLIEVKPWRRAIGARRLSIT